MKMYNLVFVLLSLFPYACNEASGFQGAPAMENEKIVFRSADGGRTWQDISKGLPADFREDSILGNSFFANDKGLFLKVGKKLYYTAPNAPAPFWTGETFPGEHSSMVPGKPGIVYWGANLKITNGTSVWSPVFENFHEPRISSAFETSAGFIFIGTDKGLFKTVDNGKTWKHVHAGRLVGHLAESEGLLLAISMRGIIRSTDDGETWSPVFNENVLAWDVKPINGEFVAMTSVSEKSTRSLYTSHDRGKTWQPIRAAQQNKALIDSIWRTWNDRPVVRAYMTSIVKVGTNYFCTHPDGIFKSPDKGVTWQRLLPSVKDKVFSLQVSGNVIYAISCEKGC